MRYLIFILCLFVLSCDSDCPTAPQETSGCFDSNACNYSPEADIECNDCCVFPETTSGQECSWQYICGYVNVSLGSESYCTNSCVDGQYCLSSTDCHSGSNITLGCDQQGYYCVTYTQEYQCGNEYICDGEYITECP